MHSCQLKLFLLIFLLVFHNLLLTLNETARPFDVFLGRWFMYE